MKYRQQEMFKMAHGGKRTGAGRKALNEELKKPKTVVIRIEEKLLPEIEKLKAGEKLEQKDVIKIEDLKKLLEKTKKEYEYNYFKSSGEEKTKNYERATAITYFDIVVDSFIKNNC